MNFKEHFLKVEKTARYYTSNASNISDVWILIHGYAQLAKNFIDEFGFLESDNTLLVAPEGLSRFYFRNKIAASWMTSEDRLNEINDYSDYLERIVIDVKNEFDLTGASMNLLGYSQGVHTAVRFFIHSGFVFQNLILCSSDFPVDTDFEKLKLKLNTAKMFLTYGDNDEILSPKVFNESKNLLLQNEISFEEIVFQGGHQIDAESIKKIATKKPG